MGDPGLYADDRAAELPVCDRGRPDGAGHDKDFVKPFPDAEKPLFCRDLPDPALLDRPVRLLCGTLCRRRVGMHLVHGLLLYLPEISAGRRTPRRDQDVNIFPGSACGPGMILSACQIRQFFV